MKEGLRGGARMVVLLAAVGGLLFDGFELGLMPVASLSVSKDLLGKAFTPALGGEWFARFTAALMFGAALGGIFLGALGDRIGRTRALGVSVLFYSVFAGLGAWVRTQEEMLVLRFLVGLGVGGVWPNSVALAAECWPGRSRPVIAGVMGAALNGGILLLSQVARAWPVSEASWRWLFQLAAVPALLGLAALTVIPESPLWRSATDSSQAPGHRPGPRPSGLAQLFQPPIRRLTFWGMLLGSIPMVGAWAASKWMIPWADKLGAAAGQPGYKALTQGAWAFGAVAGSFVGAQVATALGRRLSYALISLGATTLTSAMFLATEPLRPGFLWVVGAQGFVSTLFFGWLPLYLPELFPTRVRAAGSGLAYNVGRFATAAGVMGAGWLFASMGGSYPKVGATCGLVYLLGLLASLGAPDTAANDLGEAGPSNPVRRESHGGTT